MSLPLVPLKICARRRTVSALVAAVPVPGVSTLCSTALELIGVVPIVTFGAVLRSTAPVADTPLRAVEAATLEDEVPVDPDELDPHAATVESPRAAIRTTAALAAGRLGRTGRRLSVGAGGRGGPAGQIPATVTPALVRDAQRVDRWERHAVTRRQRCSVTRGGDRGGVSEGALDARGPVDRLHQALDPLVHGTKRVLAQHGALGLVVELEVHPVHGEVAAVSLGGPDEVAAQLGSRRLRRADLRLEDLDVGGDARRSTVSLEQVEEPAPTVDVVVGEVDLLDPGVREGESVLGPVALDEAVLDDPVDLGVDGVEVTGPDGVEGPAPEVDDLFGVRAVHALAVDELDGLVEVLTLHVQSRQLASVGEPHGGATARVVAHGADGPDGVLHRQVTHDDARLDHPQHEVGAADLEQVGRLGHVGVTDDDVQAAVLLGVGMRLVAGVDDGAAARRRGRHALPDVVGPLADGEARAVCRRDDLAGSADDLPADEERDEHVGDPLEVAGPPIEVVLVTAVGVAGGVGVVLEDEDLALHPVVAEPALGVLDETLEDPLPRLVLDDELTHGVALGRGVLRVGAHVEVEARTVAEEDVARPSPRDDAAEEVARDLVRSQAPLALRRAGHAVLVLDPEDPPLHGPTVGGPLPVDGEDVCGAPPCGCLHPPRVTTPARGRRSRPG